MAEVFGTVSAITSIVSFGLSTAQKIYDFAQSYKNAPDAIARLADDAKLTNDALLSLQQMLERNANRVSAESVQSIHKASENCRDIFVGIENALGKASKRFRDAQAANAKPDLSAWERSKWPIKEAQLKEYQWQLSNAKINLLFILNIHLCAPNITKESPQEVSVEERAETVLKSLMKEYLKQLKESPIEDIEQAFDKINIKQTAPNKNSSTDALEPISTDQDSSLRSIEGSRASTLVNTKSADSSLAFIDPRLRQESGSLPGIQSLINFPSQSQPKHTETIVNNSHDQQDRSINSEKPTAFWSCLRDAQSKSWGEVERIPTTQAAYLLQDLHKVLDKCHRRTRAALSADLEKTLGQLDTHIEEKIRQHCYQHMHDVKALVPRYQSRAPWSRKKATNVVAVQFATEATGHGPRAWHCATKRGVSPTDEQYRLNIAPSAQDIEHALELRGRRTLSISPSLHDVAPAVPVAPAALQYRWSSSSQPSERYPRRSPPSSQPYRRRCRRRSPRSHCRRSPPSSQPSERSFYPRQSPPSSQPYRRRCRRRSRSPQPSERYPHRNPPPSQPPDNFYCRWGRSPDFYRLPRSPSSNTSGELPRLRLGQPPPQATEESPSLRLGPSWSKRPRDEVAETETETALKLKLPEHSSKRPRLEDAAIAAKTALELEPPGSPSRRRRSEVAEMEKEPAVKLKQSEQFHEMSDSVFTPYNPPPRPKIVEQDPLSSRHSQFSCPSYPLLYKREVGFLGNEYKSYEPPRLAQPIVGEDQSNKPSQYCLRYPDPVPIVGEDQSNKPSQYCLQYHPVPFLRQEPPMYGGTVPNDTGRAREHHCGTFVNAYGIDGCLIQDMPSALPHGTLSDEQYLRPTTVNNSWSTPDSGSTSLNRDERKRPKRSRVGSGPRTQSPTRWVPAETRQFYAPNQDRIDYRTTVGSYTTPRTNVFDPARDAIPPRRDWSDISFAGVIQPNQLEPSMIIGAPYQAVPNIGMPFSSLAKDTSESPNFESQAEQIIQLLMKKWVLNDDSKGSWGTERNESTEEEIIESQGQTEYRRPLQDGIGS